MKVEGEMAGRGTAGLPEPVGHVVATIARACDPDRVILFGSAALGRWDPDSDVDLLVIMDSELPRYRRAAALRMLFDPYPCPMDLLVYTPEEVERWGGVTNHIVAEALRTGRVVYERG